MVENLADPARITRKGDLAPKSCAGSERGGLPILMFLRDTGAQRQGPTVSFPGALVGGACVGRRRVA